MPIVKWDFSEKDAEHYYSMDINILKTNWQHDKLRKQH